MVRYPHTAVVTASAVTVTDGEYVSASNTTTTIIGRMQISGSPRKIKDSTGNWIESNRVFFTQADKITDAAKLTVDGVDYTVIHWEQKQTHSKIWLD